MKKTKILLVLAIAMLAMFAMSACTLIAQGIEKVEFEVMPKNYFSTTEIENGITVEFMAKILGTEYDITVLVDETGIDVDGYENLDITVEGFEEEMGEHTLTVKVSEASKVVAETTYQYRVCEVLTQDNYADKVAAMVAGGEYYYILGSDINSAEGIYFRNDNMTVVIYGESHKVTATGGTRVITVQGDENKKVVGGLYEFNNVVVNNAYGEKNCIQRGINCNYVEGIILNVNACDVAGQYAINFGYGCDDIVFNMSNGTLARGWASINSHTNDSVFNIDSAELAGSNYDDDYSFGTVVFTGAGLSGKVVGEYGFNNVVNISNVDFVTNLENMYDKDGGRIYQWAVNCQFNAAKNVINVVDCTFNGEAITVPTNEMIGFHDMGWSQGGYSNTELADNLKNKLYINGTLYMGADLD